MRRTIISWFAALCLALTACGGSTNTTADVSHSAGTPGTVALSAATVSVAQNAGSLSISISRSGGSSGAMTVGYATADGTAAAGADYTATSGSLTWADGNATAQTLSIPISNATPFSGSRTFTISLSNLTDGGTLGTASATVTINGDAVASGSPGTIEFSAATASTGQASTSVVMTVNRLGGTTGAVDVSYNTADGSAVAGTDYTLTAGTLSWAAGQSAALTINIPISNATPFTGSRAFTVTLSSPTGGATLGTATLTVTINGSGGSAPTPGTLSLSAAAYSVVQGAGALSISVTRTGGSSGAVAVHYATSDGAAVAGTNYTATSGTLNWAAADAAAKTLSIPIRATPVLTAAKAFTVTLSAPTGGASLGSPSAATVTINPASQLAIRVSGSHLVDGNGNTVQLRGVNVSGLESVAIIGWDPSNPWGNQTGDASPNWNLIRTWNGHGGTIVNSVRLPLNQASWLALTCVDYGGASGTVGASLHADPGNNYKATVQQSVSDATAAGLYVILDLHLSAPENACPNTQNTMADSDHSIAFWTSVATTFKEYPNVIFELFNEPFLSQTSLVDNTPWADLLNGGGTLSSFLVAGNPGVVTYTWHNAGMQQMLNAVRATGATNVVLTAPLAYASAMDGWLQYKPTDSANQLGAVWHAYPGQGFPTLVNCIGEPACSPVIMADVKAILAAGYPVVITEFGDFITQNAGNSSPWASVLLPFADTNGISYLGWTWDAWTGFSSSVLITDEAGDPTNGYGTYVKQHYTCVAAGTHNCP